MTYIPIVGAILLAALLVRFWWVNRRVRMRVVHRPHDHYPYDAERLGVFGWYVFAYAKTLDELNARLKPFTEGRVVKRLGKTIGVVIAE